MLSFCVPVHNVMDAETYVQLNELTLMINNQSLRIKQEMKVCIS